ncbi:MAG: lytic transglycosylase domain-containing protein [Candidatus Woesearchaeota archaeon]
MTGFVRKALGRIRKKPGYAVLLNLAASALLVNSMYNISAGLRTADAEKERAENRPLVHEAGRMYGPPSLEDRIPHPEAAPLKDSAGSGSFSGIGPAPDRPDEDKNPDKANKGLDREKLDDRIVINREYSRRINENVGLLLNGDSDIMTWRYTEGGGKVWDVPVPYIDLVEKQLKGVMEYKGIAEKVSEEHDVESSLILALIAVESGGKNSTSSAGARGIMQMMEATAERYGLTINDKIDERYDPEKSISAGTGYLAHMLDKYNNNALLSLAGYNCGDGRINRALKAIGMEDRPDEVDYSHIRWKLPKETRNYVIRVMSRAYILEGHGRKIGIEGEDNSEMAMR